MFRLGLATIFTLPPILGFLATDGVVLAQMDRDILMLMVGKVVFVAMVVITTIIMNLSIIEKDK